MDQAKIATDGTLSWNIRAGWRKRPILLPYQIGMAGIAIFIAFAATMFLVVTDPAQPTDYHDRCETRHLLLWAIGTARTRVGPWGG